MTIVIETRPGGVAIVTSNWEKVGCYRRVLWVKSLHVDGGRYGGSGGNGSGGELLTRSLLLRLCMLGLATGRGVLHLVDVVGGGDGKKRGHCAILPLVV